MKQKKRYYAWIAVPSENPSRLDAGYWTRTTRRSLLNCVRDESFDPGGWTLRRVELRPICTTKRKKESK